MLDPAQMLPRWLQPLFLLLVRARHGGAWGRGELSETLTVRGEGPETRRPQGGHSGPVGQGEAQAGVLLT